MANKAPIKRLELEFVPSNITGYDSIIKINAIREPGFVGAITFVEIDKFVVDKDNADAIKASERLMNYIGNGVYMSTDIFMGGIEIVDIAKDKANLKITSMNLRDFRYLLDFSISDTDLLLFSLTYIYDGAEFKTPIVISYRPIEKKPLFKGFIRPCITIRNNRFRGPNESDKYDQYDQELYSDIKYIDEIKNSLETDIARNITSMDDMLTTLYNITDQVKYYQKYILSA